MEDEIYEEIIAPDLVKLGSLHMVCSCCSVIHFDNSFCFRCPIPKEMDKVTKNILGNCGNADPLHEEDTE